MVWRDSPHRPVNQSFTAFAVSIACWAIGVGATHTGHHMEFWTAVAFASAGFSTVSFFAFIAVHAPADRWSSPTLIRAAFILAAAFAVLSLTTPLIVFDTQFTPSGVRRTEGSLYLVFAAFILLSCGGAFAVFISKWRRARGRERARLQYLVAGMLLPVAAAISTNLLWPLFTGRSTLSWIGPWLGLIFAAIVGHGIIRRRLPDLRLVVHRSLTLTTATALSAVPAGVLVSVLAAPSDTTRYDRTRTRPNIDRHCYGDYSHYAGRCQSPVQSLPVPHARELSANGARSKPDAHTGALLNTLLTFISATVMRSTGAEGVAIYLPTWRQFRCVSQRRARTPIISARRLTHRWRRSRHCERQGSRF